MTVIFGPPNAVRLERCPVTEIFYKLGLQPSRRSVHQSKHRRRTAVPCRGDSTKFKNRKRTSAPASHSAERAKIPFRRGA